MEWQVPDSERTYLRELAKKQAEYAALPDHGPAAGRCGTPSTTPSPGRGRR